MDKTYNRYYIQDNDSLTKYFGEISNIPLLSPEEEVKLAAQIRKGNRRALSQLIQANLRFVVRIALEYKNQGLPLEDLINDGNLGLIKAAKRFDETKGFKFISYAVWWIRQSILQSLTEQTRAIRLPNNRINTLNRIGKIQDSLEQIFEREPTADELAESLDMTTKEIHFASTLPGRQLSLDASLAGEESPNLLDITGDHSLTAPDQQIIEQALKDEIEKAFESLTPREAEILKMYFGFDRERPATLEEIGQQFNMTRERVRQIKERAITRLRHKSRSKYLKQFLG
jgi:RNA polymerase primary sigma factor